MRRLAPAHVALGAIVGVPALAALWMVIGVDDTPAELLVEAEAVVSEPTERVLDGRAEVVVMLSVDEPADVVAGDAQGVVTAVHVEAGDVIRTGVPVFAVDGVDRIAAATTTPFYRSISAGSRGRDVRMLEQLLVDLGHLTGEPSESFAWRTTVAVRALEAQLGVQQPKGTFDPGLVVWLPDDDVSVGAVNVRVGTPSPGLGGRILSLTPAVSGAYLAGLDGSARRLDRPHILHVADVEIGLVADARNLDEDVVRGVLQASEGVISEVEGGGGDLSDGQMRVPGTVRWPVPETVWSVPAAAVMVDSSGSEMCVWRRSGATYEAVRVDVVDGVIGRADIVGPLRGVEVLANPASILDEPQCP